MPKSSTVYVCRECGHEHVRWQGKCDSCSTWNSLEEFKVGPSQGKISNTLVKPITLEKASIGSISRIETGVEEIDRVFGGGFIPGSLVLLSGEPGIGKSTLLLQIINLLASKKKVLYWSAEESVEQIASRAKRLKINRSNISLISTLDSSILDDSIEAEVVIVDSIQTVIDSDIPAGSGSITQVRGVLSKIQVWAKENNRLVIVVGHVTKDGSVAGPKTLEHLVDVVAVLEGDSNHDMRILRTTKNRFGPTNEVGVFSMNTAGLEPVSNPSKIFLSERLTGVPGSVVTATMEGTRPFLVEVQALTSKTFMTFPKRTASGIDSRRLDLIIAILERRGGVKLYDQDVFVNIVGGIKVTEPAIDLAIAISISSATWQITIPPTWCVFGEIGLAGEIRSVKAKELREREAKKLGFVPLSTYRKISDCLEKLKKEKK